MPPRLELTESCSNAGRLFSSRNSPQLSLRKAGSYNFADKGPLSSTSSRFNFNHLIASPPPSPGLPALIPRHGKPIPSHKPRKFLRGCLWLSGVLVILYYGLSILRIDGPITAVGWAEHAEDQYEMVGDERLPDFPTPVVVTDKRGRAKWTVSIPPDQEFPLQPIQYADICKQNMEVAHHVTDLHKHVHHEHGAHFDYYHVDDNFMDVAEAEAHGLLPGSRATLKGQGSIVGEKVDSLMEAKVCEKTMTFVLETADAGLGKTLMMLWTAYGLATKEGREFFVDDSRWAYGEYTTFFQIPPLPNCRPPPRYQMLPCPHHARHLLVSAATASSTFGGAFNEYYEDARKMEVYRQKPVFDLARIGYKALFHLAPSDAEYASSRIQELRAKTLIPSSSTDSTSPSPNQYGTIIGIHVRHGDRHPYEFQYRDSYVPVDRYTDQARTLLLAKYNSSGPDGGEDMAAEMKSVMVVASDDPDVYDADEVSHALPAQERIRLASKKALASGSSDREAQHLNGARKFVEEAVGWEGGFFAGMFWSLGKPSSVPATAAAIDKGLDSKIPPSEEALRLRELVGRAYLLDLAVLGEASDSLVCTVSSMGCKLLAVMMGWERAVVEKQWVNVDGDFEWRGVMW